MLLDDNNNPVLVMNYRFTVLLCIILAVSFASVHLYFQVLSHQFSLDVLLQVRSAKLTDN